MGRWDWGGREREGEGVGEGWEYEKAGYRTSFTDVRKNVDKIRELMSRYKTAKTKFELSASGTRTLGYDKCSTATIVIPRESIGTACFCLGRNPQVVATLDRRQDICLLLHFMAKPDTSARAPWAENLGKARFWSSRRNERLRPRPLWERAQRPSSYRLKNYDGRPSPAVHCPTQSATPRKVQGAAKGS